MAKIFITGSCDGLGLLAARLLIEQGNTVVLHARNEIRKKETAKIISGYKDILVADLANIDETKLLAQQVNTLGRFDAVIHNAGVYNALAKEILNVNVLAPYILTCSIEKPQRLIYLSSAMHLSGNANSKNIDQLNYADSKLYVVMLCKVLAQQWPNVYINAVNPGWVPTKMGGKGAPDDLQKGAETQVWLAVSNDSKAKVSGYYFFHQKQAQYNAQAGDESLQSEFLKLCEKKTGIMLK